MYRLPGYPGPYGDQAFYYLIPISEKRIVEAAAHRYYFRSGKKEMSANPPGTDYGAVIESILKSLKTTESR